MRASNILGGPRRREAAGVGIGVTVRQNLRYASGETEVSSRDEKPIEGGQNA